MYHREILQSGTFRSILYCYLQSSRPVLQTGSRLCFLELCSRSKKLRDFALKVDELRKLLDSERFVLENIVDACIWSVIGEQAGLCKSGKVAMMQISSAPGAQQILVLELLNCYNEPLSNWTVESLQQLEQQLKSKTETVADNQKVGDLEFDETQEKTVSGAEEKALEISSQARPLLKRLLRGKAD